MSSSPGSSIIIIAKYSNFIERFDFSLSSTVKELIFHLQKLFNLSSCKIISNQLKKKIISSTENPTTTAATIEEDNKSLGIIHNSINLNIRLSSLINFSVNENNKSL